MQIKDKISKINNCMQNQKNSRGIIKTILIIIVALIILGYFFNIKIQDVVNSSAVQANLSFAWGLVLTLWSFISYPFVWIWDHFIVGFIWAAIQSGLSK